MTEGFFYDFEKTDRLRYWDGVEELIEAVYEHLDRFVDLGLVEQTREVAGSKMYVIDTEDDDAEKLAELEWTMIDRVAELQE
ncbi:MAG: hypothetical protein ACLFSW_03290 [Halobacteriales archaeon]